MNGLQGLLIAAALGVVGAVSNWFYVHRQASGYEKIAFVGVNSAARLNHGDVLREQHLERIEVPRDYAGNLRDVAVTWDARSTVVGMPVTRGYPMAEILLQQDVLRPVIRDVGELLGEDELAWSVAVDARTFVAENFNPGDQVSFVGMQFPTPAGNSTGLSAGSGRLVGPFRILRMGSRGGSLEVDRADRRRPSQENVLTIALTFKNGQPDQKSRDILDLLEASGNKGLQVVKHPAPKK